MERLRIPPHLGQNEQRQAQYSPSHDKFEKTSAVARHLGSLRQRQNPAPSGIFWLQFKKYAADGT